MIIAIVPETIGIPKSRSDKAGVIVDIIFVCTKRDIGIIGIVVLDTTKPYVGLAVINLRRLACAAAVSVTPDNTVCYGYRR